MATLDGKGSLHGMGIIAISTAKDNAPLIAKPRVIRRLQQRMTINELLNDKAVPLLQYICSGERGLASIIYKPVVELQVPQTLPADLYSDVLWHSAWTCCYNTCRPRPSWSGVMQHAFSDGSVPKSEVLLLPIIDLNPSDESCIYSTLIYIQRQAEHLNITTPCITFDQPLWLKALEIITSKSMNIVCRLGGFHTMMSFMGSIGSMMKGSGLEEALETVYGPNAVSQMMSGKAVSRALRGHFIVEAALVNKLLLAVLPVEESPLEPIVDRNDSETNDDNFVLETHTSTMASGQNLDAVELQKINELYKGIEDKSVPVCDIAESKELVKLKECLLAHKAFLAEKSRTAKLWLQYIEYVETLKVFIRAERTGNWYLHLLAVEKMLNLFAATGHIHYAKSARLYLQQMRELPSTHPWLHHCFSEQGFHTVRRSCRYWAGLWTDLIIEQVMMRSIKSRGGLTRGRGVTESVRLQWVYSMHKCAGVHDALTTATSLRHRTSEQHVELGTSRSKRDCEDLKKIQNWFDQYEPFNQYQPKLCSLSTGLTAADDDNVNCDQTEQVGCQIHKQLNMVPVANAAIKRSDQVRTLDHLRPGILVDKKKIHINPTQLFTRLIGIVQREDDMAPFFNYELTSIPTSLFKNNSLRKTDKAQLARSLKSGTELSPLNTQARYVLDGGALIHRVKWEKKVTYRDVVKQYVGYVRAKYNNCFVVFDGYQSPSIKDSEHQRRAQKACADIQVTECIEAHAHQETFYSNKDNKAQFILLLSRYLKSNGQTVHNSTGDADTLIVNCALQIAMDGQEVNVVADDTDVLILLMHHWRDSMADVYILSQPKSTSKKGLQVWRIRDLVAKAGTLIVSHLLFLHAWSGCDSTSATFGQGKTSLIKKIQDNAEVQQISSLISDSQVTAEEVGKAGARLFVILYGGKQEDSLNFLRYVKFMDMVSSSKEIDPQKLPPTERAAHYHSLRVHLQVILWKKLMHEDLQLNPQHWGWTLDSDGTLLSPIMTDMAAAPETLLKFVRCKCKLSSRNPCGTNLCSCRKHGLKCVTACGDCRGEGCGNAEDIIFDSEED